MSVFVDTSAILATIDADDPRHAAATRAWRDLIESGERIVTSNYVILETVSLLHSRLGADIARKFIQDAVPAIDIVWVDRTLHDLAVAAALAVEGKSGPSLVDCVSFQIISTEHSRVFAYDKHFAQKGYPVIG